MINNSPLVSIGLPLYNAGEHTRRILDNLTSQDYPNLEIVVSDNASTDDTWAICQEYASQDARIRLYQNETNRGYMYNFERVYRLAIGTYFMWAAHDDYWHPTFVSCCTVALEAHPTAVMCYTDQIHINEAAQEKKLCQYATMNLADKQVAVRVRNLLFSRPLPHAIFYGLFRREMMLPAMPIPRVPSADIAFLFRVLLIAPAIHVPEVLYERNVTGGVDFRKRMAMLRPGEKLPPNFVIVLQAIVSFINDEWHAPESLWVKLRMMVIVVVYVFSSYGIQFVPVSMQPAVRRLKRFVRGS